MGYVHYCVFCGRAAEADTTTMLEPSCANCGCALRACAREDWPRIQAALADGREERKPRLDGAGPLVGMTAGPFLLPILGVEIGDVLLAVPIVFMIFAAVLAAAAARREGEPREAWFAISTAAGAAAAVCGLGLLLTVAGLDPAAAQRASLLPASALLVGFAVLLRGRLRFARPERVLDIAQPLGLVLAASVYFALVPGWRDGDPVLTAVVLVDLLAFGVAGLLSACSRRSQDIAVGRRLWCGAGALLAADGLVAAAAAGTVDGSLQAVAALYALGAWFLASAATSERPSAIAQQAGAHDPDAMPERRWFVARVTLPTLQIAAFPLVFSLALAADGPGAWPIGWFGGVFVVVVLAAFARQAFLVLDHRRAVIQERRQRQSAQRRNTELEALTGLATTMTQTLEEAPIVEQALTVLHTAARASSSALHVADDEGRRKLRASAGDWQGELPWADRRMEIVDGVERFERGRRQVTRLELAARGHDLGWVTFVRPVKDPLTDRELALLRLLVDQMAIAIANARDYREKLEQAVRDPLTGVYNRRYFFEALEKEVQRSGRYGSAASLVLFDVDDFKRINDTHGHAVGDDVLRGLAGTIVPLLRPVDSFARIGGEEFALLLPETEQLEALLVAERLRAAVGREELAPGLRVTVSAGVGSCPADATSREDLVRRTDAALYWAKRNGKDMCAVVNDVTDIATEQAGADRAAAAAQLTTLVGRDHAEAVAYFAAALGEKLGFDRARLSRLRRAALLHDVGNVAVRAELLDKPGPLTDAERAEVRQHVTAGAAMLEHAGLADEAAWVRHHHERVDGTGYPDGLRGDSIPLEARIIFIADAFEAMVAGRPYRPAMAVDQALAELRRCSGSQFEPRLVDAFRSLSFETLHHFGAPVG